jgi:hypothetical protein
MDIEDVFDIGFGFLFAPFEMLGELVELIIGVIGVLLVIAVITAAFLFLDPSLGMLLALVATGVSGVIGGGAAGMKLQKAQREYN